MGFGLLLIGYFFVSVVSLYSPFSFAMLIGYPLMITGLWRLAPYQRNFRTAFYLSPLSLPFALYYAFFSMEQWGLIRLSILSGSFYQTVEWLYFVFVLLFTALWLYGILSLCRELELLKLQSPAVRALFLFLAMYVLDLISRLPIAFITEHRAVLAVPVLFMRLLIIFLILYLLYGCYRYIAPEDEAPTDYSDPTEKAFEFLKSKKKGGNKK